MSNQLPEPLNAQERFLHSIAVRQGILIEQISSIIEHLAQKDKVAVQTTKAVEKTTVKAALAEPEEVVKKPVVKRAPRKKSEPKVETKGCKDKEEEVK